MKKLVSAVVAVVMTAALAACASFTPSDSVSGYAAMREQTVYVARDGGHGSGVIVGPRYVLTAKHVVEDAKEISVRTARGGEVDARVVWIGGENIDAAMLEIKAGEFRTPPAKASCVPLAAGQMLYASGYPLEDVPQIVTSGRVVSNELFDGMQLAELPLIPGMSGGPVYNARGELVALNTAVIDMPLGMFVRSASGVAGVQPLTPLCEAHVAGLS